MKIYFISFALSEGLLRIKFNDELLFELEVDIVSCGKGYNLRYKILSIVIEPLGCYLCCHLLSKCLNLCTLLAGFLNCDNVSCLNKYGGDSYLLAVKSEVAVKNKLTSFLSGCCHTHSVYDVVKASLKKCKEVLTCDTSIFSAIS